MTPSKTILLSLALLGHISLLTMSAASGQTLTTPVPLEVRADVAQSGSNQKLVMFVTLHNQSPSTELTNVLVKVGEPGVPELDRPAFDLKPGQVRVERFDFPATENTPYVLASFSANNQAHSMAVLVTRPASSSPWPLLLPIISTLVGGILGAWLVNFFTGRREKARSDFEWSKMVFEKYESSFRQFLAGWKDLSSGHSLKTEYDILIGNAHVPLRIRAGYERTFAALTDQTKPESDRKAAGQKFKDSVEQFMKKPFYD